ncbi:MAG: 30S ribosomal protein S8e [Nanopusillaceae archaeon]
MVTIEKRIGLSVYQGRDLRKENGKIKTPNSKKRKHNYGRFPTLTRKSEKNDELRYKIRTKGGNIKIRLKEALYANVLNPETKEIKRVKILEVVENPNDKNLNREKIITKNTIINTEMGKAVVVSRPGQDGVINAILLKQ